ncbi:MAG: hypothetical protein AAF842_05190 [Planctomycetota bacterium]
MSRSNAIPLSDRAIDPTLIDRLSPVIAWALSAVALLIGAFPLLLLVNSLNPYMGFGFALQRSLEVVAWFVEPGETLWRLTALALGWLAVEVALVSIGLANTGWSSGLGERLVATWRRGVVAVWVTVPIAMLLALATLTLIVSARRASVAYDNQFVYAPGHELPEVLVGVDYFASPPPQLTPEQQVAKAWHEALMAAHYETEQRRRQAHLDAKSWLLKHEAALSSWTGSIACLSLANLFLWLSAPHERRRLCLCPPLCDRCGYLLSGVTDQPDCPECGHPVRASLGPTERDGAEADRPVGLLAAMDRGWRTYWTPVAMGRRYRLGAPIGGMRRLAYSSMWLTSVICGPVLMFTIDGLVRIGEFAGYTRPDASYQATFVAGPMLGAVIALGIVVLCVAFGGGCDPRYNAKLKRNNCRVALQAAISMMPLMPLGIWLIMLATLASIAASLAWLGPVFAWLGLPPEFPLPSIVAAGVYLVLLAGVTRAGIMAMRAGRFATQ